MKIYLSVLFMLALPLVGFSATINVPANYPTIQQGIDAAKNGDTVLVAPGTYVENLNFKGKAITVKSSDGANVTSIDGGNPLNPHFGSVVLFDNGEGIDSVLDGFTLKNGTGTYFEWTPGIWNYCGGGILCHSASPTITNTIITGNTVDDEGGGIYCRYASPIITNALIAINFANQSGGGIYCYTFSSPTIKNSTIIGNVAHKNGGGGISCIDASSPTITDTLVANNSALQSGGGIDCRHSSSPTITNSTISGNAADWRGGGILCSYESHATVVNTTIYGNKAKWGGGINCAENCLLTISSTTITGNSGTFGGGGVCSEWACLVLITNAILWNNTAPAGPEIYIGDSTFSTTLTMKYCDVKGGKGSVYVSPGCTLNWGAGMIDADPLFADPFAEDFHLSYSSPCRNAGDNSAATQPLDFEEDPRIHQGIVDMGADEFHRHLYYTGDATPGGNLNLKFIDNPNTAPVVLWLGSGVLNPPMHLPPHGDWRLQFPILLEAQLGSIPGPDGVLSLPCKIPSNIPVPLDLPLQAGIGVKLTNLCVLKIE